MKDKGQSEEGTKTSVGVGRLVLQYQLCHTVTLVKSSNISRPQFTNL